ncbi:MAG: HAD family hydrolase [Clostridiales bacterium]|nr:HAD family hydrolase [Clostridiales bacterium]
MIKAVLFDMDGTLVPMDQNKFVRAYFKGLSGKLAPYGYEPKALVDAVWKGTDAMVRNDGNRSNSDVFWDSMCGIYGEKARDDVPFFDEFYRTEFCGLKSEVGYNEKAAATVMRIVGGGKAVVLASNPVFPRIAQTTRVGWAGIDSGVFSHITSYENSHYCKPNPKYYEEIASVLGVEPSDCLMVGNDAREDVAAAKAGMKVFLLTDCLINVDGVDIADIPHGDYDALNAYLDGEGL